MNFKAWCHIFPFERQEILPFILLNSFCKAFTVFHKWESFSQLTRQFQALCLDEMKACFVCPHKPKVEQREIWWIIWKLCIRGRNLILERVSHQASFWETIAMRLAQPVDRYSVCVGSRTGGKKNIHHKNVSGISYQEWSHSSFCLSITS